MTDICFLARFAYDSGMDPIDYAACAVIQSHVDVQLAVCAGRADNPANFPGYWRDLTTAALSRRILGDLLDAGWKPPEVKR